jgi:beta-galactosidase
MKIGTYYYPEQWPREQWERDFDRIASMGLGIVHMAEFAWFTMEPRPGEFQFDWLNDCIEMARQRELDVILCTPTAAPPVWLSTEFPETLPVDRHGTPARFGGRRHYNPTSPALHEATKRIVTAMADRFGDHPSVVGWQIDNEYGGDFDQSEHTHAAFREWLRAKYDSSIDKLNRAWGNQFWNTYYTSFEQILMPARPEISYDNPHQRLDAQRFWSHAFARFNKLQADILKPRIGKRYITTNFMPFYLGVDPSGMLEDLSVFAWDSYPVTGWGSNIKGETYRLADPAALGFVHEQMASYTGRWALLEVQLGQVNWSGVPVLLYPGAVRLWLWTAYAHGAEFITTYRFRQPRFGTELFHHGLVLPDGVTLSAGGREFVQVIDELKMLNPEAAHSPAAGASGAATGARRRRTATAAPQAGSADSPAQPEMGLVFDFEQLWYYRSLPQAKRWDQPRWITLWYAAAARLGWRVRVLLPDRDWPASLPIIVAPGVQMVDDALVRKFDDYASEGGNLVLTCRSGLMDRTGQLREGPLAAPIVPLIGATIEAYDGLPEDTFGQVELIDGEPHPWGVWGDLLYAEPTTKVLAKYASHFYAGAAAVTRAKRGKGTVTYCGVFAENSFIDALLARLAKDFEIPVTPLPPRVNLLRRGPHRILLNYQDQPVQAPAAKTARFVLGSTTVEPAGVAVWVE